jgi:hypothetical protein
MRKHHKALRIIGFEHWTSPPRSRHLMTMLSCEALKCTRCQFSFANMFYKTCTKRSSKDCTGRITQNALVLVLCGQNAANCRLWKQPERDFLGQSMFHLNVPAPIKYKMFVGCLTHRNMKKPALQIQLLLGFIQGT